MPESCLGCLICAMFEITKSRTSTPNPQSTPGVLQYTPYQHAANTVASSALYSPPGILVNRNAEGQKNHISCQSFSDPVCTLHPTHYTLHPAPCNLHPAPYTLHPEPCTLRTTPCTLHPTPHTPHPTPYTLHPIPYTSHSALNSTLRPES